MKYYWIHKIGSFCKDGSVCKFSTEEASKEWGNDELTRFDLATSTQINTTPYKELNVVLKNP